MGTKDRKVIVVGDSGVGKTSIVQRYVNNIFQEEYKPTTGAQPFKKTVEANGDMVKLVIWDVAGHLFRLHPAYSSDADGVVLVCDMSRVESADALRKWLGVLSEKLKGVPFVISANKSDIADFHPECREELPADLTIVVTSAKTGSNVDKLFQEIISKMC